MKNLSIINQTSGTFIGPESRINNKNTTILRFADQGLKDVHKAYNDDLILVSPGIAIHGTYYFLESNTYLIITVKKKKKKFSRV